MARGRRPGLCAVSASWRSPDRLLDDACRRFQFSFLQKSLPDMGYVAEKRQVDFTHKFLLPHL